jgi:hypothetical protein
MNASGIKKIADQQSHVTSEIESSPREVQAPIHMAS